MRRYLSLLCQSAEHDSTQLHAVAERLSISLCDHHPGLLTCIGNIILSVVEDTLRHSSSESAQRRVQRRRIVQQTQTRPEVTSIRPQVRVPVSHMWLLALFWGCQLLPKLPTICVYLQKAVLIILQRGRTGRQAPGHPVATSHRPLAR